MLRKRMNKKGFTLVEIIVVLVILAILAAILIPSMVKWIDKAQEKSAIVAGRTMLLAAQTIASEKYAAGTKAPALAAIKTEVEGLAGLGTDAVLTGVVVDNGAVTAMTRTYQGKTVSYSQTGGFTCMTTPTTP